MMYLTSHHRARVLQRERNWRIMRCDGPRELLHPYCYVLVLLVKLPRLLGISIMRGRNG